MPAAAPGAPANPGEHSHAERAALPLPAVVCPGTTAPPEVVPQAMHTVSAVLLDCEVEYLPTAHSVHTDEPALTEYLPAPQSDGPGRCRWWNHRCSETRRDRRACKTPAWRRQDCPNIQACIGRQPACCCLWWSSPCRNRTTCTTESPYRHRTFQLRSPCTQTRHHWMNTCPLRTGCTRPRWKPARLDTCLRDISRNLLKRPCCHSVPLCIGRQTCRCCRPERSSCRRLNTLGNHPLGRQQPCPSTCLRDTACRPSPRRRSNCPRRRPSSLTPRWRLYSDCICRLDTLCSRRCSRPDTYPLRSWSTLWSQHCQPLSRADRACTRKMMWHQPRH